MFQNLVGYFPLRTAESWSNLLVAAELYIKCANSYHILSFAIQSDPYVF